MIDPPFEKINWNKAQKKSDETLSTQPSAKLNQKFISYKNIMLIRFGILFCFIFLLALFIGDFGNESNRLLGKVAFGESSINVPMEWETPLKFEINPEIEDITPPPSILDVGPSSQNFNGEAYNEDYSVQAVLGAKRQIVLSSGIDSKITKFNLESGDRFKKGDVLIEYDCSVDRGRLSEAMSRQRVTEQQLAAYQQLSTLDSISNIELLVARENNIQNKALISQIKGRLKSCTHVAPWDGRVMRKMASQYEYVQSGRVLMEIASHDPLRAEFLIPSKWLRWLNVDTPVEIYIGETDMTYTAKIINVFGEVDPVSQSIQVVAEMQKYYEELLPGMSGKASFTNNTTDETLNKGFLGLKISKNEMK